MNMIRFDGLTCQWCKQFCTRQALTPEAKAIRTEAIKTMYPEYVKTEEDA